MILQKQETRKAILAEINNSKMAFLDCEENIYTIGDFIEDNGILYSNSSYKERAYLFNFSWDDYVDYEKLSPLDDGYIITESKMIECDAGSHFIGKGGKIYEYNYYFDVAVGIKGVAYNVNGFPVSYDEENSIWINVLR